jgi:4,5-DOPA dioxygenase extradiol
VFAHVPPIFVSHGAPTLAVDQERGAELAAWARALPRPRGIVAISAHWQSERLTRGTTASPVPLIKGFRAHPELDRIDYRVAGAPELAYELHALLPLERALDRGLDHGVFVPLLHMYPHGDVPVVQLSLVAGATPRRLYAIGRKIGALAARGYLLMASGAITHNDAEEASKRDAAIASWAREFDAWIANHLADAEVETLLAWRVNAPHARKAHPTSEHLDPLFVVLGAASLYENAVGFPIRGFEHGTRSLRSVQFGR